MSEDAEVRVHCPWCGTFDLAPAAVRCADAASGEQHTLCEFTCPGCGRLIIRRTTAKGARLARRLGVARFEGTVPLELLEPRSGPPLSWDDVLDLHLTLSRICCPHEELRVGDPGGHTAEA